MITITDLRSALLDLLYEIKDTDINLIIGGGYGIYLKTEYVRQMDQRTLLREWPEPRSTNDLELFLRPELLIERYMPWKWTLLLRRVRTGGRGCGENDCNFLGIAYFMCRTLLRLR